MLLKNKKDFGRNWIVCTKFWHCYNKSITDEESFDKTTKKYIQCAWKIGTLFVFCNNQFIFSLKLFWESITNRTSEVAARLPLVSIEIWYNKELHFSILKWLEFMKFHDHLKWVNEIYLYFIRTVNQNYKTNLSILK